MKPGKQFSPDRTHAAFEEARMHTGGRGKCRANHVEMSKTISVNGVDHAGTVSHPCVLAKGHDDNCRCACGRHWKRQGGDD